MQLLSSSKQELIPMESSGGCETIHWRSDASAGGFVCETPSSAQRFQERLRCFCHSGASLCHMTGPVSA
jgi:hypothetical protein